MNFKLSKEQIKQEIKKIFTNKTIPTQEQIKKAKKLAMSKNIKLGPLKKKFCKKCFTFFTPNNFKVRIKKGFKIVRCKSCDSISRYKLK